MKKFCFTCISLLCVFLSSEGKATRVKKAEVIQAKHLVSACLTEKWNKPALLKLKKNKFVVENSEVRDQLALQLLNCLASPDVKVRDGIAFESLSYWMRNNNLSHSVHKQMFILYSCYSI